MSILMFIPEIIEVVEDVVTFIEKLEQPSATVAEPVQILASDLLAVMQKHTNDPTHLSAIAAKSQAVLSDVTVAAQVIRGVGESLAKFNQHEQTPTTSSDTPIADSSSDN